MFISNRTARVFALIVSKTSLSTSPVGNGVGGAGDVVRGVLEAKSWGIGGSIFVFGDRGEASSVAMPVDVTPFSSIDRVPSASTALVCCEETLKNDEEPLLGLVANVVVPEGRPSFSFSPLFGRSLLPRPKDNLDVFLTIERRGVVSLEPDDACLRWP